MFEASLGGSKYFMLIVNDFSRFKGVYFLSSKFDTLATLICWKNLAEKEFGHTLKPVWSDRDSKSHNSAPGRFLFLFLPRHISPWCSSNSAGALNQLYRRSKAQWRIRLTGRQIFGNLTCGCVGTCQYSEHISTWAYVLKCTVSRLSKVTCLRISRSFRWFPRTSKSAWYSV